MHTAACSPILGVPAKLPSSLLPSLSAASPQAERAPPDALPRPSFTRPCRDSLLPVPVYSVETTRDHVLRVFRKCSLESPGGCCASQALSSRCPGYTRTRSPGFHPGGGAEPGPTGAAVLLKAHRHPQLINFNMPLLPLPGSTGQGLWLWLEWVLSRGEKSEHPVLPAPVLIASHPLPPSPEPSGCGEPLRQPILLWGRFEDIMVQGSLVLAKGRSPGMDGGVGELPVGLPPAW